MTQDVALDSLATWLREEPLGLPNDLTGPLTVTRFPGGQSNPTYRLDTQVASYVLRRQPYGTLLPSAHAVDREYRLFEALHPQGFPVPAPIRLCRDPNVIGSMFYIMEHVPGRSFWQGAMPGSAPPERAAVYEAMLVTLARLHAIDPVEIGLGDFGRPGAFFSRQIHRWTQQYRAAQTDNIEEVEKLIAWLPASMPEQSGASIIHGDYRIDNLLFASDAPDVRAVIDWELATLGDPMADIAYLLMNWVLPEQGRSGIAGIDFAASGIPSLDHAAAIYCEASGRDRLPELAWYFAYGLFRLVAIVQGIKKRMANGNASSAEAADSVAMLLPLARAGWDHARQAGAA